MYSKYLAICIAARDCESSLICNIPLIEKIRSLFRKSKVIAVENSSKDKTRKVLEGWSKAQRDVVVLSPNLEVHYDLAPQEWNSYSKRRIDRMSQVRNAYMSYLDDGVEPDLVMVVDVDVSRIPFEGIQDSLKRFNLWDAVFSLGLIPRWHRLGCFYYDTYATVEKGNDSNPFTLEVIFENQKRLLFLRKRIELYPIVSAFGGLALYRYESIRGLRYRMVEAGDSHVTAVCEHVTLHRDMIDRGYKRLFVNPRMVVWHHPPDISLFKTLVKVPERALRYFLIRPFRRYFLERK